MNDATSSATSSRIQSPLPPVSKPYRHGLTGVHGFINKIPPVIRYGVPFGLIGYAARGLYDNMKSKYFPQKIIPEEKPLPEPTPVPQPSRSNRPVRTPMPKPTFNPKRPRTGYRYSLPLN